VRIPSAVFVVALTLSAVEARAQGEHGPTVAGAAAPAPPPRATPLGERLRGLAGVAAILAACYALSEDRRAISKRAVFWGLALQVAAGVVLLQVPAGRSLLGRAERFVEGVLDCAVQGAAFVFGDALTRPDGPAGFVFAFRVLPTIIFVSALFAVLYHLGIMQRVVGAVAWVMARLMGSSGAESLNTAASLFLGQTEAPLTIRPYLPRLTRSELLVVMVSGMGLVSGGVLGAYIGAGAKARDLLVSILMSAPATIFLPKILIPEGARPETLGTVRVHDERPDANLLDAAARGTREGMLLAANVAAMLIAFLALIALVNRGIGAAGAAFGRPELTMQALLGHALAPVAWLMGVPAGDCRAVGGLLGSRAILNELIAYGELGRLAGRISPRAYALATIALCGFANISSIGIQIGGIGALIPDRRADLARLGLRALLAATLANILSACIAGVIL
jgi:CNT family concentrative nucleoside transporter